MKYRKEFKEQVIKTYIFSPYLSNKEIAENYNISVSTFKKWIKEFYAEQFKEPENEEFSYNINWEKVSEV